MKPALLERCRRGLVVAAAAYLVFLPSNALSFWRSLAFVAATALAAVVATAASRGQGERLASPGRGIVAVLVAWSLWCAASLAWSIDRPFTASELKSDLAWNLATGFAFYVATLAGAGRVLFGAALCGLAFWPAFALGLALSPAGWDARLAHMGVVAYSTYLVTAAPFLLLLAWRPPLGWNTRWQASAVGLLVLVVVVATARLTDNRIVWLAFGTAIVLLVVVARPSTLRGRTLLAAAVAVFAFSALFVDAMRDRARYVQQAPTTVEESLLHDPRLAIWRYAAGHLGERPLTGFGYGRLILRDELRADTGNHLLTHAHNMFVSQAVQTGLVGVALLAALLAVVAARYVGLARAGDPVLRCLGALGLAVLAAFVVKNLTDDFFFRANAKLLFALNAMLLGTAVLRERTLASQSRSGISVDAPRPADLRAELPLHP